MRHSADRVTAGGPPRIPPPPGFLEPPFLGETRQRPSLEDLATQVPRELHQRIAAHVLADRLVPRVEAVVDASQILERLRGRVAVDTHVAEPVQSSLVVVALRDPPMPSRPCAGFRQPAAGSRQTSLGATR